MIRIKHCGDDKVIREYQCTVRTEMELCFANMECLLNIALADSDEHIRELGGEKALLNLMNGYLDLAVRLKTFEKEIIKQDKLRTEGTHDRDN